MAPRRAAAVAKTEAPATNGTKGRKRALSTSEEPKEAPVKRARAVAAPKDTKATKATKATKEPKAKAKDTKTTKGKTSIAPAAKARKATKRKTAADSPVSASSPAPAPKKKTAAGKKAAPKKAATKSAPTKKTAKNTKAEPKETTTKAPKVEEPKKTKAAAAPKPVATPAPKKEINSPPTKRLNVYVFGEGESGELGLGTKNSQGVTRPRLNPNLDATNVGVVALAVGGMHCVALTADNKIFTWGVNDHNALGRDTTWDGGMKDMDDDDSGSDSDSESGLNPIESTPTAIPEESFPAGTRFAQVTAGDSSSFALTTDGLVYGWGTFRDSNGKLAFTLAKDGTVTERQTTPLLIPGLKDIVQISAGGDFALALDAQGNAYAWGIYQQSQVGRRVVERHRNLSLLPSHIALPKKKTVAIYAAVDHAFAIDNAGEAWAWGSNNFAQTGITDGAGEEGNTVVIPKKISSLSGLDMVKIQGGSHHSIGLSKSGKVYVWGRIDGAQGGIDLSKLPVEDESKVIVDRGKPRVLLVPTEVAVPPCADIAAGSDHNVVITKDGQAYSWGFNTNYQCGQGNDDDVSIATLINNTAIREKKLTIAGAGAQFSLVAGPDGETTTNGTLSNGTNGTNGTH